MWPKAIAQLIELAPHITRLVPVADRFLQSKSAADDSTRKAMDAMAEGLRGDLGQVTASHAGLYRQLNDQSEKLSAIAADLRTMKTAAEASDARLVAAEARLKTLVELLSVTLFFSLICFVVLIVMFLHSHK